MDYKKYWVPEGSKGEGHYVLPAKIFNKLIEDLTKYTNDIGLKKDLFKKELWLLQETNRENKILKNIIKDIIKLVENYKIIEFEDYLGEYLYKVIYLDDILKIIKEVSVDGIKPIRDTNSKNKSI